jgi:hypothetical protein
VSNAVAPGVEPVLDILVSSEGEEEPGKGGSARLQQTLYCLALGLAAVRAGGGPPHHVVLARSRWRRICLAPPAMESTARIELRHHESTPGDANRASVQRIVL